MPLWFIESLLSCVQKSMEQVQSKVPLLQIYTIPQKYPDSTEISRFYRNIQILQKYPDSTDISRFYRNTQILKYNLEQGCPTFYLGGPHSHLGHRRRATYQWRSQRRIFKGEKKWVWSAGQKGMDPGGQLWS